MRSIRSWTLLCALTVAFPLGHASLSHALNVTEICDNCVDDDGDQLIDRKDPDCSEPADGMGQNVGDESEGKALAVCAKAAQKAGFKLVLGVLKKFQKCTETATTCIQAKPGDASCQAKAAATCAKTLGGFDAVAEKFRAALVAKCDPEGEHFAALTALSGLGFSAEQEQCGRDSGIGSFTSMNDIATCITEQHFCRAQHLVTVGTPRARELLTFAGRPPGEFPCIDQRPGANGAGAGVPADHVKKTLKCGKTIDKLALSLIGTGAKTVQNCLNAGIACLEVKGGDQACVAKAQAKCTASFDKLQNPSKGTVAKIGAKLQKACSVQDGLSIDDIRQDFGLGFNGDVVTRCNAIGNGAQFGLVPCLGSQAFCEGAYMIERQVPRARELADFLGVVIPGVFD